MPSEPRICGYPRKPIGDSGEYEMKEISFGMPPAALRDIARFLQWVADEIDKGPRGIYWHRHIDEYVKDWRTRFPEVDIVAVDLRTYVSIESIRRQVFPARAEEEGEG